jgi:hypothetical protein
MVTASYRIFTANFVHRPTDDETQIDDGISIVKTEDSAQLILSGFGLFLGKKSERLIVRKGKEVVYQFPFFRIQEVVIASKGISVSSDLLEELCVRGIRLNFWGTTGKPYALITSPHLNATIQTRRDQLEVSQKLLMTIGDSNFRVRLLRERSATRKSSFDNAWSMICCGSRLAPKKKGLCGTACPFL